jgi:hypothetical protein
VALALQLKLLLAGDMVVLMAEVVLEVLVVVPQLLAGLHFLEVLVHLVKAMQGVVIILLHLSHQVAEVALEQLVQMDQVLNLE